MEEQETIAVTTDAEQPGSEQTRVERLVMRSSRVTVTLYCGDCHDLLPIEADAVVTDPPYYIGGAMISGGGDGWMPGRTAWATSVYVQHEGQEDVITRLVSAAPLVAIWGGNYHVLPVSRGWLVWHKPDAVPTMANAELAWTNQNQNTKQLSWSIAATNAERCGHPTQKPVKVMIWTMEQLKVPDVATVLDPYMGSGSTGVACIRTGRNFIGVEKDEKYFEIAAERIRRELAQERLF